HVRGTPRDGDGQVIALHLAAQLDDGLVLGGQRRCGQAAATTVDALVVRQRAADQYGAVQLVGGGVVDAHHHTAIVEQQLVADAAILDQIDRKSTRLNSSHVKISYAVFCLKK